MRRALAGVMARALAGAMALIGLAGCGAPGAFSSGGLLPGGDDRARLAARKAEVEALGRIDGAIDAVTPARLLGGNRLELLVDGKEGYDALEAAVKAARRSIWFETFIWHNDATGQRFARLLARRKAEGLDVRVLVDPLGMMHFRNDRDVLRVMLDHGVQVRYYKQRVLGSLENVTHRKLYLFDGHRGFTGGMNIGDEYAFRWHDLLVDTAGPVARDMHRAFADEWNVSGAEDLDVGSWPAAVAPQGAARARVLETDLNEPDGPHDLQMAEVAAIDSARETIRMAQLFLSDDTIIEHLERAARRGVAVQVLLSKQNEVGVFRLLNQYYGARLKKAGVQLRFYEPRFSHVKYLSVDGAWIMLGSANADTRSYEMNQELSLGISDAAFTREADRRVFDPDFAMSLPPSDAELHVGLLEKPVAKLADWLNFLL